MKNHSHNHKKIELKFDPKKLEKLNNPERLKDQPPDYIWEKLNLEKCDILIDIGAGTGFISVPLLKLAQAENKEAKLYACDISDIMLQWMKDNVVPVNPNLIPLKSEESKIPLEDGVADLVFMFNLHHELEEPDSMLKEVHRLLKPSGKLCIVDWKKEDMEQGPPKEIRYRVKNVEKQLDNWGFKNISSDSSLSKHFIIIAKK